MDIWGWVSKGVDFGGWEVYIWSYISRLRSLQICIWIFGLRGSQGLWEGHLGLHTRGTLGLGVQAWP